ncbi:MAG: glutaminyl-peptide cyclotransferase [Phycisphaerae bacterium]|nr:glutaminyl-peptide cyclotransferase [Phycisphaerae bacterium]
MRSIHVVLGILVLSGLGISVFLAVRTVPAGEESKNSPPSAAGRVGYAHHSDRTGDDPGRDQPTASSSSRNPAPPQSDVAHYRYKVVKTYPHDRRCFTQGLVYEDGFLYEGTGLYGQSALYKRDLQTGKTVQMLRLPEEYFGEGITLFGDKLIQLTWQSHIGFVYRKDTFAPLGRFKYATEGWGLTHDGKRLILSDGTAILHFLDPNTYAETGRLQVRDQGRPVPNLNELEFIDGVVYANIWQTDRIAIIDPKTGRVTGWIDLSGLYTPPAEEEGEAVLNGIAYLPQTRHLLVTGKLWPRMYEIELVAEQTGRQR